MRRTTTSRAPHSVSPAKKATSDKREASKKQEVVKKNSKMAYRRRKEQRYDSDDDYEERVYGDDYGDLAEDELLQQLSERLS
jgi:hypothetical protein